jgi:hypothetical protein
MNLRRDSTSRFRAEDVREYAFITWSTFLSSFKPAAWTNPGSKVRLQTSSRFNYLGNGGGASTVGGKGREELSHNETTNSVEHSPSWEANSRSACQETVDVVVLVCDAVWTRRHTWTSQKNIVIFTAVRISNITVKKFPAFYGTWRFIAVFITARNRLISRGRLIQSTPPNTNYLRSILILSPIYV